MEELAIIGSGPAGLTAAIYAARAKIRVLVIEGMESGGELTKTGHVANFPGFGMDASGPEIMEAMRSHAEKAGAAFKTDVVESVDFSGDVKILNTMMGDRIEAKAVIVATGAGVEKTGKPGEGKYWGRGISACLTCDAALYAGKKAVVVGEGSGAAGAKKYLEKMGAEVPAVVALAELKSFTGDGARLTGVETASGENIAADGAFLVTARVPQTGFLGGALALDGRGHIVVTEGVKSSARGVFAAGDCMRRDRKQAIIAAGDGALAALEAQSYIAHVG